MSGYDNFMLRAQLSGRTPREVMVKDSVRLEALVNEDDPSYCGTFYRWINGVFYRDGEQIHPRLYDRKHSSAAGHTMKMKTLITEPIKCGDTFHNTKENTWWICTATDCVDDINYISTLTECNYTLKFQMHDARIFEYKCFNQNSTQYNSGVTESKQDILLSSQHMLTLPDDDIILSLHHDKRFFLSKNPPLAPDVYRLTQNDSTSNIGLCKVTVTQTELNRGTDNLELGICDYIAPNIPKEPVKTDIIAKIEVSSPVIRVNTTGTRFYARFHNKDRDELSGIVPDWKIESDFINDLFYTIQDDNILISTSNEDLIDKTFTLKLTDSGKQGDAAEMTVAIEGLF